MDALTTAQLDKLRQIRRLNERSDVPIWLMETADGQFVVTKSMTTTLFSFRARALFVQRLRILLHLRHPHVAAIYAGKVRRGNQCLTVMHYTPRGSLFDAVQPGERRVWSLPLPLLDAARLTLEIADGLAALHARDLMHGGLKLSNVLLEQGNDGALHVQLADALLHRGITGYQPRDVSERPIGVADPFLYVAPEQYNRHPSLASDRYALGVIAFLLLTGEAPYTIDPIAFLQSSLPTEIRKASELNPILPPAVDEVIARMLRYAPRERYRTVREFTHAFRAALNLKAVRRSATIKLEAMPQGVTKTTGDLHDIQAHETLTALAPLAMLGDDAPGGSPLPHGMPMLPINYHWSPELVSSLPILPDLGPERDVPQTMRVPHGNMMLITLIVVIAMLLAIIGFTLATHLLAR